MLNDGGNLADLRRAVNVTTSDLGRLGHPLQRLLTNTTKCFCRYNGTTKGCLIKTSVVFRIDLQNANVLLISRLYFVGCYIYGTLNKIPVIWYTGHCAFEVVSVRILATPGKHSPDYLNRLSPLIRREQAE